MKKILEHLIFKFYHIGHFLKKTGLHQYIFKNKQYNHISIGQKSSQLQKNNLKKVKACIVYLFYNKPDRFKLLCQSLECLEKFFNKQFQYPIIIFHEGIDEWQIQEIKKRTSSQVKFERINFEAPSYIHEPGFKTAEGWRIGYLNMCRFYSGLFFNLESLKEYDYYLRLDDDSFFLSPINYDFFSLMEKEKFVYGYQAIMEDNPNVVKNIKRVTEKFIEEESITPTFYYKYKEKNPESCFVMYTNFEAGDLNFWRGEDFQKYFRYLDAHKGFHKYRWGDTPVHYLGLSLFSPESKIVMFDDVAYKHQDFINLT